MGMISKKQQATILKAALMGLTVLLVWGDLRPIEAGCQRFGHSCFGAHGKRAEIPAGLEIPEAINYNLQGTRSDYDSVPISYQNNNRMSPYLIDWIMRRGDLKQLPREDLALADKRRRK